MHRGESQTAEGQPLKGICSFYSPRMRALWREACASGDLDGFLTAATDRVRVWCETVPVRDTLLARQKMLQQQAMTQALAGVAFQGMENVTMASSAQSGTGMLFGGGTLGWHPTMYGAEAAQANQAMLGGFAQALDGNVWTTMAALEERWKAVA
ncbi:hypothetical protein VTK73DRAFT_4090 [Phialemonium thermophilum]|uniref:Uncharacterized protein n=1 Tax=Phialemonium thermophilum TaxID=223376 RepID=A0ABR3VBM1_9PEZI